MFRQDPRDVKFFLFFFLLVFCSEIVLIVVGFLSVDVHFSGSRFDTVRKQVVTIIIQHPPSDRSMQCGQSSSPTQHWVLKIVLPPENEHVAEKEPS